MLALRLSVGMIDDFFGVKRFHPQKLSKVVNKCHRPVALKGKYYKHWHKEEKAEPCFNSDNIGVMGRGI